MIEMGKSYKNSEKGNESKHNNCCPKKSLPDVGNKVQK